MNEAHHPLGSVTHLFCVLGILYCRASFGSFVANLELSQIKGLPD